MQMIGKYNIIKLNQITISAHHVHHVCGLVFLRPSKLACVFIIFHYFLVELVTDKSSVALAVTSCFCLSSVISIAVFEDWLVELLGSYSEILRLQTGSAVHP